MKVSDADLSRLSNEIAFSKMTPWEWAEAQDIEKEAMHAMLIGATEAFLELLDEKFEENNMNGVGLDEIKSLVASTAGNAFRLGWVAHEQFAKTRR